MTTEQLKELARITMTVRDVLAELRIIVLSHAGAPAAIREDTPALGKVVDRLQLDLSELANRVQDLRAREWLLANPHRRRTSADVTHGLPVPRYGMTGRLKVEASAPAPSTVGRWQTGSLGRPKPRQRSTEDR